MIISSTLLLKDDYSCIHYTDKYCFSHKLDGKYTIILQEINEKVDINTWENKRGPRPWEDNSIQDNKKDINKG